MALLRDLGDLYPLEEMNSACDLAAVREEKCFQPREVTSVLSNGVIESIGDFPLQFLSGMN